MAVKIEKGGWVLIFLIGLALVGYSLNRYNLIDLDKWIGKKGAGSGGSGEVVDATKPLVLPVSSSESDAEVRVRVNIWVGCVGGLVANGGLDTAPESIFGKKGLKVSFKIIDDWTEGAAALATNNVDVMLTTARRVGQGLRPVQGQGLRRARLLHGGLVARRRRRHRQAGHQQHRRPRRQDRCVRAVHSVAFSAVEWAEELPA